MSDASSVSARSSPPPQSPISSSLVYLPSSPLLSPSCVTMPSFSSSFPAATLQGSSMSRRASNHSQRRPPRAPSSLAPNSRPFYSFPPPSMHDERHPPSPSLSSTIASSPLLRTRVASQQPIPSAYLEPTSLSSAPGPDVAAAYSLYSTTRMDPGPSSSSPYDDQSDVVNRELDLYPDFSSLSDRSTSPIVISTIPPHVATKKKGERKPDKMHPCAVCHKQFPRPSALETHMNTHNKVFPYRCSDPGCPKSFSVRSNARRHFKIHTDKSARTIASANVQIKFAETIIEAPRPEPLLNSSSDSFLNVRWVGPNMIVRGKPNPSITAPARRKKNCVDALQTCSPNDDEPPMVLYAPYPSDGPSSQDGGAY
ncbi:hypothetical protein R3P38DRAFT_1880065 [Favolaschia claudopus]|uniref:C2H2-type domain-containing protein n=1 Tax=Favolaschia claudopus TaxID=2862362 RepID=A0AAW0DBN8_9AGAR